MARRHLLLFGDQTVEPYPTIKHLARQCKDSLTLQAFFRRTTDALQSQIATLNVFERARFFSFDSILGLAESHVQSGVNDVVVSTVLLCIAQLGCLIIHAGNDPSILDSTSSYDVHILGLCTGLLPAAAAATSRSADELLKLAPEVVCISLRLALETSNRSIQLEQSTESWAVVVCGIPAAEQQRAIDEFHKSNTLPSGKYAYISAEADSSTTISGPPSTLALLFSSSDILSSASKVKLPISAAFHARHLKKPETSKIVGSSALLDTRPKKNAHIMSTGSSKMIAAESLRLLLDQIVDDVISNPLYWTKTVQAIVLSLGKADVVLTTLGPTTVTKSLHRILETAGIKVTETGAANLPPPDNLRGGSGDIAIVGMSGRFPGGESLDEFWKSIEQGRDLHKKVPKDRFDVETHCDPSGMLKNTTVTPFGCFMDHPGFFDARLFNMSPREAAQTDPTQRLILMTTYEALEMAGYSQDGTLSTDSRRIGTFFGQTTDDWRETNAGQNIDLYYVSGGMRAFGPGRLNYHFKWEGPSYSLDTACSSSSASVQMACAALLARDCDTAVAGGGNILTGSPMFSGLSRGSFLSPTGSCKTFDDDADGYCRGEGVGSIVLKRLEDAIADHDNIRGVIKSVVTNHSAHAISITHPHAGTQERLYRSVLQSACVEPSEVGYVEMHGTGTQAGDTIEVESVTSIFGQGRKKDNPLYIGAVKSNVGHGEAAAGITSLIKVMMMMAKDVVPPHPGIKGRLNHKFPPLAKMNVHIPDSQIAFKAPSGGDGRRRVLLNNFNATGGNTCMLLEDGPQRLVKGEDPRSAHVIAISARTSTSLQRNKMNILDYLNSNPDTKLADLSYTTTARRMHHVFRTAHAVGSIKELVGLITKELGGSNEPSRANGKPSIVFAFTGQGSQYAGMGKQLFDTCVSFRENILEFNGICLRQGLPPFLDMITESKGDMTKMTPTQIQLGLVSLELGLARFWQSCGIEPDVVIGHSLGEYAALCVAGVLSVSDMLFLVGNRARIMEKKCTAHTHAMLAIQSSVESVMQTLKTAQLSSCEIACINGPSSTVVSGPIEDVKMLKDRLQAGDVKTTLLEVPYAFHSAQMDPILSDFEAIAHNVRFAKPAIAVASTLLGELVKADGVFTANYLARQARQKVDFVGALRASTSQGVVNEQTLWVENGPASVCLGLVRSTLDLSPTRSLPSLKPNEDCWKTITKALANAYNSGAKVLWPDYHKEYENALTLLDLPTYAFDLKDYWLQYEGDWALKTNDKASTSPALPAFSTTCLQRVESESYSKDKVSVVFVSNAAEPKLYAAVQGHLVTGVGLCPSSVYSDMAFTAASYIHSKMEPSKPVPAMDVAKMEVHHPLIVLPNNPDQLIRVSAVRNAGADSVTVSFGSQNGSDTHEHGHCIVHFGNGEEWKSEWARNAYLVKMRIDGLTNSAQIGVSHKILRKMVYKLFAALVAYDEKYHGLEEVFMDSELHEAAASVKFQTTAADGNFTYSPYWIDSIVHLAGFVLNGSVNTPEDVVYISHGWKSLRIAGALSEDKSYSSYVRMQPTGNRGVYAGDVYMFEGDEVVAVCTGLKFQEMKKTVLQTLLGTSKGSSQTQQSHGRGPATTVDTSAGARPSSKKRAAKSSAASVRKQKSASATSRPSFSGVLHAIASEVKVDVTDFVDDANFGDLGIDSLLTISIMSNLRTQMGLDLPTSIFTMYPTVAELRVFFEDQFGAPDPTEVDEMDDSDSSTDVDTPSNELDSSVTSVSSSDVMDAADVFISAVATETGIDAREIEPSTLFVDLGVDSLMSIAVLGAVKDRTGRMLPASIFTDYPTVADLRKALGNPSEPQQSSPKPKAKKSGSKYSSHPVFLQGRLNTGLPTLFMIADGAGSAASYLNLPPMPFGIPVYALESPFLHCPLEFTCSFEEMAAIYVEEIRNIQPRGPYMLGGWSLGGIHAYEVARQLIAQGETVKGVVMVDSPCPKALPHMPEPTIELMEQTGVFIGIKRAGKPDEPMPMSTKQHLVSCVKALKVYDAIPMQPGHRPGHVVMIWAKDGVFERVSEAVEQAAEAEPADKAEPEGEESHGLKKDWLTAERKSFGPNGWDRIVGDMECHAIDGDHFSIMNPPRIKVTGAIIYTAVKKFME